MKKKKHARWRWYEILLVGALLGLAVCSTAWLTSYWGQMRAAQQTFEKLAQALETVFNNTEYQAECEKTGQLEIMEWHDSAEATEMVHQSFELLSGMAHYFE